MDTSPSPRILMHYHKAAKSWNLLKWWRAQHSSAWCFSVFSKASVDPCFLLLMASGRSTKIRTCPGLVITRKGHLHNHTSVTTNQARPKREPLEDHPVVVGPVLTRGLPSKNKKSEGSETYNPVNAAHHIVDTQQNLLNTCKSLQWIRRFSLNTQ